MDTRSTPVPRVFEGSRMDKRSNPLDQRSTLSLRTAEWIKKGLTAQPVKPLLR